jgi:hypothetical protein
MAASEPGGEKSGFWKLLYKKKAGRYLSLLPSPK